MKFFQPLSSETVVSSVSPLLYRYATPHNATGHGREEGEIQSISFAKIHVYPHRFNIGGEVVKESEDISILLRFDMYRDSSPHYCRDVNNDGGKK